LIAGRRVAVIERPNRKRLQVEVAAKHRKDVDLLLAKFGGHVQKLPQNWLKKFQRSQKTKPIRIGKSKLVIPAGAAFGTGEHATTAMCLRLLDRLIRCWGAHAPTRADCGASPQSFIGKSSRSRGRDRSEPDWHLHARRTRSPELVVDLGTGSGILALASALLGAKRVIGIDNDPIAVATARKNARRNKIRNVTFQIADVTRYQFRKEVDVVTANLFSELLIRVLPRLKRVRWLILSGILREQEDEVVKAVCRAKYDIAQITHRGRWLAILAERSDLRTRVTAATFQRL
jgi:ribosomal protein L11 methyltransferase